MTGYPIRLTEHRLATLRRRIIGSLLVSEALLALLHIIFTWGLIGSIPKKIWRLFHVNREMNLPTWFSASQLTLLALILILIFSLERYRSVRSRGNWLWLIFAAGALFLSLDEFAEIHEKAGTFVNAYFFDDARQGTFLYMLKQFPSYYWALVYVPIAVPIGIFLGMYFWRKLGPARSWAIGGMVIFLIGAVVLDYLEGRYGNSGHYPIRAMDMFGMRFRFDIFLLEELMEMIGITMIINAFLHHLSNLILAMQPSKHLRTCEEQNAPTAKEKATSSPLTKTQVKGFEEADGANKTMKIAICIFLIVSTFAVYSQVQDHGFLNYDDNTYVTKNLNVKAGLTKESVYWAFTTSYFSNWHPMTWLSYMLDHQLYGSHPKGHHLTNLFFHIANALILFMVLLRMTGALWQSGFIAAMFALHPINIESVAWIAERKNVLSTFFWLLTMWSYIHYAEKPSIKSYGLVALFFVLGLMSKSMLVTLPFVLLLLDYWPLRRLKYGEEEGSDGVLREYTNKRSDILRLVHEKIPLFLLAAGASIVTFIVARTEGLSLSARLTNAMVSYLEYLEKMVWPKGLAVLYPHPGDALAVWEGILCGMILVSITATSIRLIRKAPYFAVGWFWYLGTLVPVIGIVQAGNQAMADRYAYVPLIGIFIIVAWGLPELMAKWHHRDKVLTIATGVLIPTLMVISWGQVSHWKNSITIFKHAIRVTDKKYPTFAAAHSNLGLALFAERKTEEAISHYKTAIKLKPDYANAYNNLGVALFAERKTEEGISHYKTAIGLKPVFAQAHNNLGLALFAERKTEEAISHYKTDIKLKPDYAKAYNNLETALLRSEELE